MKKLLIALASLILLLAPAPTLARAKAIVFDDEFDGTQLDASKWGTCYSFGCTNAGNNELEWYQPANVTEANGLLTLTAQPELANGFPYTSGMIDSDGRFSYLYGYAEIRAKTVSGRGLWPAFWTIPSDHTWPPEIDVLEQIGQTPTINYMTVHYFVAKNPSYATYTYAGPDYSADFHTYGMDWEPGAITWYIDGVQRAKFTNKKLIPSKPMYLVANLAVGGNFPGSPDASTPFPSGFQIDYIRVSQ